jgi:hypothetical protein
MDLITRNVARSVEIIFSGGLRVKSSVGLQCGKVGLTQRNTLGS